LREAVSKDGNKHQNPLPSFETRAFGALLRTTAEFASREFLKMTLLFAARP
jgi:hypothetical protein